MAAVVHPAVHQGMGAVHLPVHQDMEAVHQLVLQDMVVELRRHPQRLLPRPFSMRARG